MWKGVAPLGSFGLITLVTILVSLGVAGLIEVGGASCGASASVGVRGDEGGAIIMNDEDIAFAGHRCTAVLLAGP